MKFTGIYRIAALHIQHFCFAAKYVLDVLHSSPPPEPCSIEYLSSQIDSLFWRHPRVPPFFLLVQSALLGDVVYMPVSLRVNATDRVLWQRNNDLDSWPSMPARQAAPQPPSYAPSARRRSTPASISPIKTGRAVSSQRALSSI